MDSKTKSKWQVRLAVLAIFAIGFIAGGLAMNFYRDKQGPGSFGPMHGEFSRVIERLNLSPEQKTQVDAILDDARSQLTEIRKESGPRFHEVRKRTDERLQTVLTPEQWEQFQQIMKEGRHRRHRGRDSGREDREKKP